MNRQRPYPERWILGLGAATLFFVLGCGNEPGPTINERFPIKTGDQLSPPVVAKPIHECAEAVHVTGFVPHATINVYVNVTELVGTAIPPFAFADISLSRALKLGESVTATQTVGSHTSVHSLQPVIVSPYDLAAGGFEKPEVNQDLYACGVIVPVGNLVPSVRVHVLEDGVEVGSQPSATEWTPVWTAPLTAGRSVTALQIACETDSLHKISSPPSDPVTVQPAPNPVPAPGIDAPSLVVGNDAVVLTNLYVGSHVVVFDNGITVGGGWTTAGANWVPISQPLTASSSITATQELCGVTSPPSDPVPPSGKLEPPVVLEPICQGARFVVIRNTFFNATVVVMRNGAIVGYGGSAGGDLVLALGDNTLLVAGDIVTAQQYVGPTISPVSNVVTVVGSLGQPAVEISGGEPFFLGEGGEQAIDGPVFPRGRGPGPLVLVTSCCGESAQVEVRGPDGMLVAHPQSDEVFPGYYAARWDWSSQQGWSVPSGIPVGKYTATVRSGCRQREAVATFYVIFNPDDVSGPARFSFNETEVWFGTPSNGDRALLYHVHPDDRRVFGMAIGAASGMTDPRPAAEAICDAEEARFAYSLNYHTNDVLDLLENFSEAQCADDAGLLVGLLRSVGIPAHPVTADAGLETGAANWTFDTWVEYLVPDGAGPQWLILHPHEYDTMAPETRSTFGATRGVATKSFNDLIIMAGETWVWSEASDAAADVTYRRNNCQEPEQVVQKKPWVDELCENGYWSQTHWDCVGSSAQPLTASMELNRGNAGFGRSVSGVLTIRSEPDRRTAGPVVVEVASDLLASKGFPDSSFDSLSVGAAVEQGGSRFTFSLSLPRTIRPGHTLYVVARVARRIVAVEPLPISSQVRAEIRLPSRMTVGQEVAIEGTISNVSKQVVSGVSAVLRVPFAIDVRREPLRRPSLSPDEAWRVQWTGRLIAPLEAGSVTLEVGTEDGGADTAAVPIQILGAQLPSGPIPSARPSRER